jgi:uncharacterized protein
MGANSKFVWHDLMAADVEGAKKFYGELFGWRFEASKNDPYQHIYAGPTGIGGLMKLEEKFGAPPHWLGYIGVDDVDAAVTAVKKNGGQVHVPATAIENVGQFAIVADPQGAVFSPFHHTRGAAQPESDARPAPYTFCWDELLTSDPDAAAKFYGAVFGWGVESMEIPGFGRYTLLKRTGVKGTDGADRNAAGVIKIPPGVPRPFWLSYVAVPDADEVLNKAKRLGATPTTQPMDIPGVGRFATLLDPQHAALALLAASA